MRKTERLKNSIRAELTDSQREWLERRADAAERSMSFVLRELIDAAMAQGDAND